MMKRGILVIIMMISSLGLSSFKNSNNEEGKRTSFASYYHDKFNGRRTASGDIFDNSKLTAANRSLPFGTKIKVTNLRSGKSVIVEINDRGPFHASRALDLSRAAYEAIGNPARGTMPVEYEIVEGEG
ncbi:septal ring lytic transglycosylase RlpA family protein [Chryseobacterium salipaludis]|uniref:septal ring lytic transglycosylase RlpA family protein n=1 Tax=Chryseobacterium TaxID=59732 RepID=UPI001FF69406|nr:MULTISPECIES: septal ring lytic transglycosylase RlpA family protein [Chryseobacterium]MCJ8497143.1 septal ring lytic transglycosylase RlpA family protein [Chryseobacterium salipaludis]MCX3296625.1 septal ring lytic transglycosylase RlpA family protein [Planobacterium sp. JC490]